MGTFQYNWATAEMVKMYLRNSRAQEKRKARKAAEAATAAQDPPVTNPGPAATGNNVERNDIDDSDSDDSVDDE